MATTSSVSIRQSSDVAVNDHQQNEDNISSTERVATPIQPLVQPRTNAYTSSNVTNPKTHVAKSGFTLLKSSTIPLVIGHPLAYIRVLMQMGYEPLPAFRGKTLFGKEALYYPNAFQYLKYVYRLDGFTGLYRGFGCSLLSKVVCVYTTAKFDELLGPVECGESNEQTNLTWNKCIQKTLREVQTQSWGIFISHPFQVMAIRCMGQFIGREKIYSSINIFQNITEIYEREGIGGFFVGLIPRWLLEISTVVIANVLIQILKTQLSSQSEMGSLYEYIANFIAQTVTYPLSVVTTVTTVNQSGLRAGMLPLAPIYVNWQDAYRFLKRTDQLKRGSGLFNRAVLSKSGLLASGTTISNA